MRYLPEGSLIEIKGLKRDDDLLWYWVPTRSGSIKPLENMYDSSLVAY